MQEFLKYLGIYLVILAVGIFFAYLYRKRKESIFKVRFDNFMKLRAFLLAQLNTLARLSREAQKDSSNEKRLEEEETDREEIETTLKDIETNLIILKTEIEEIKLHPMLQVAKEKLEQLVGETHNYVFSLISAPTKDEFLKTFREEPILELRKQLEDINPIVHQFIKEYKIEEKDYFYEGKELYI